MKLFVNEIIDGLAFIAIAAGIVTVCAYFAPNQRSAECESEAAVIAGEVR